MRASYPPIGMSKTESDIYSIALYVGMPGGKIEPFLKVLEMCGYELREKSSSQPQLDSE